MHVGHTLLTFSRDRDSFLFPVLNVAQPHVRCGGVLQCLLLLPLVGAGVAGSTHVFRMVNVHFDFLPQRFIHVPHQTVNGREKFLDQLGPDFVFFRIFQNEFEMRAARAVDGEQGFQDGVLPRFVGHGYVHVVAALFVLVVGGACQLRFDVGHRVHVGTEVKVLPFVVGVLVLDPGMNGFLNRRVAQGTAGAL